VNHDRIIRQLDRMVDSGQLTEQEATRLRATEGTPEFEQVVATVRARHAEIRMVPAVAAGEMSQAEADAFLDQLRSGAHPNGLRARLAGHHPRSH